MLQMSTNFYCLWVTMVLLANVFQIGLFMRDVETVNSAPAPRACFVNSDCGNILCHKCEENICEKDYRSRNCFDHRRCRMDGDCSPDEQCRNFLCIDPYAREPTEQELNQWEDEFNDCRRDGDCGEHGTCEQGQCKYLRLRPLECRETYDCNRFEFCSSGNCVRRSMPRNGQQRGTKRLRHTQ